MFRAPAVAIGLMLYWIASTTMAIGFDDRYGSTTVLGQPLDFSVVVNLGIGDWLSPECVGAEVTAGDNRVAREYVHVHIDSGRGEGQATLRIITSVRIHEPVVTVQVTLNCTSQISRQFVAFIDPPLSNFPIATAVHQSHRAAQRSAMEEARESRSASAQSVKRGARPNGVAPPRAAPTGSRLMLESAQQLASADLRPETVASVPSDEAVDFESRLRERDRLASLEQSLERLRQQNAEAQQSLAALQIRLRESQAVQVNHRLVYGLLTLVVLLLLAVAALLWRQWRMPRQPVWWGSALAERDRGLTPSGFESSALESAHDSLAQRQLPAVEPAPISSPETERSTQAMSAPRELSVEELIDLEQQADFFVVLGQDEAAIDLLMGHVRSSGGASPMPYLKLLEIYRRRGERDAYERIRERFNRRFNAYAPDWEVDPRGGRTLEGYAEVMDRLQAAWPEPLQAMGLLEALLFTRDSSDQAFDLPAFGDLLFLYSQARDLAEREAERSGVDLLLPLASSKTQPVVEAARPTPKSAGAQAASAPASVSQLERIDLNFDAPSPTGS